MITPTIPITRYTQAVLADVRAETDREVRRVKSASLAWDDLAATVLTGEGFEAARERFWRIIGRVS